MKPKIQIELVDKKGSCNCHRGHKNGDIWDFDTQRGEICPILIKRTKGKEDARQRIVTLTYKGLAMQEQAKHIPECLSVISLYINKVLFQKHE